MAHIIELSDVFIEDATQRIKPHWGELGWVTYKRTYARFIEDEQRKEEWHETVKRVVEGNINLDPRLQADHVSEGVIEEITNEAESLFELMYSLAGVSSGRNLWISGTEFQQRNGDALNNCWFIAVRPQAYGDSHIVPEYAAQDQELVSMPFSFLFDQSMKGGGVGFSVSKENMDLHPEVGRQTRLTVITGKENADYDALIEAGALDRDEYIAELEQSNELAIGFTVPDSREGWVEANAFVIDAHYEKALSENIIVDVSEIRGKGEKIKGFGGTASGAAPLVQLLLDTNDIVNGAHGRKLSSVEATDIMNIIGRTVVAGNVRRTAEIGLSDATDKKFITMKQDEEKLMSHRWASNNSVIVDSDFDDYEFIGNAIAVNGEPGIFNIELSQNFGRIIDGEQKDIDGLAEGTNPCGEISLENGEPCNLFEVFPLVAERQGIDVKEAYELAARFAKRVTFTHYEWEVSRNVIQKNRRIGISMSGIQDWVLKNFDGRLVVGWDGKDPIYNHRAAVAVDALYQAIKHADKTYSAMLGVSPSNKLTTVKPSGTVSKLVGMSEGVHFHYDGHLIQRIRFQGNDPILVAIQQAGFHIEDDVYSKNTKVVEFLVKAPTADEEGFVGSGDVSIAEQFASQAFMQTYWADNAVSCTITFHENEKEQIPELLKQYSTITKSTSLLPFSGHGYKQTPKEPISAETYNARKAQVTDNVKELFDIIVENDVDVELVGTEDCEGGMCPIK